MEVPLRCVCGESVVATEGMAGSTLTCRCGRTLQVPSLGEMKDWVGAGSLAAERSIVRDSVEPLERPPVAVVYGLTVAWICLAGLPLFVLCFDYLGPVAAAGVLLLLASQVWLFTQIFSGNPMAGLIVLFIPFVGPALSLQFIIAHWAVARWPVLCQIAGLLLLLYGSALGPRH
jgi:hypothetical protein